MRFILWAVLIFGAMGFVGLIMDGIRGRFSADSRNGMMFAFALILGSGIGLLVTAPSTNAKPGTAAVAQSRPEHDKIRAYVMCQDFVEEQLKAPSTAKWPQVNEARVTYAGGGNYVIHGWVDSQNSFGATLRTGYMCDIQWVEGGTWRLKDLQFDP